MKKTLVALAVLAAAGSVSAAEVYNNDGVSVAVSGSVEVQAIQGYEYDATDDFVAKKSDGKIRLDDGDLTITTAINIQEGLDVVGGLSFDLTPGDRQAVTDKLYVGFASADFGTVTFGRQTLLSDDDGVGKDYELGFGQYDNGLLDGYSGWQTESANEVIKYVYDNGQYYAGLSHNVDAVDDNTSSTTEGLKASEARVGARFGDADVRAYYFTSEDLANNEVKAYTLEAEYTMDALTLGASYGNVQAEDATGADLNDRDSYEIVASYTIDKATYALGYVYSDDSELDATTNNVYANVTYKLHDNVKVYAETGWADIDVDNEDSPSIDLGYLVGMEVNF